MEKGFQITAAVAVAILGMYALYMKEVTLAATSLGILGGILNAPKQQPMPPATLSDVINQSIIEAATNKGVTK